VKPATSAGQREVSVYLPGGGSQWFALDSLRRGGPSAARRLAVLSPLDKIPVFIRAGTQSLELVDIVVIYML